jgi:hypothetical protein
MKLRLNYWQLILLFSPFWVLVFLSSLPLNLRLKYHINLEAFTIIITIDLFLAIFYQAYLVILFTIKSKAAKWMIGHTVIPVIFSAILVMGAIVLVVNTSGSSKPGGGPVHNNTTALTTGILFIFTLHLLVTFFVINNLYVFGKLDKIKNLALRDQLTVEFSEPLRKMFIVSLLTIAGSLLCAIVIVVIRARYFS